MFFWVFLTKRGTPPQRKKSNMAKGGTLFFADGDVHVPRQIDSEQHVQRLAISLDASQPSRFFFFFFFASVMRVNESDQKWGVSKYPLFGMLTRGYTPPYLLSLVRFYPFLSRRGLVCPGLARKHRRWATVPARGCCGTTKRLRPTSKRPTAQTHSNVISLHT